MNKVRCLFDKNSDYDMGCRALKHKYCKKEDCSFYKSSLEYVRNKEGYIVKRSDYNGNASVNNR